MNLTEIKSLEGKLSKLADSLSSQLNYGTLTPDESNYLTAVKNKISDIELDLLNLKAINDSLGAKFVLKAKEKLVQFPHLIPILGFTCTEKTFSFSVKPSFTGLDLSRVPGTYRNNNQKDSDIFRQFLDSKRASNVNQNPLAIKISAKTPLAKVNKLYSYGTLLFEIGFKPRLVQKEEILDDFIVFLFEELSHYLASIRDDLQQQRVG